METNHIVFKQQLCQCKRFHSEPTAIKQTRGVLQGDSLSPYLFAAFIDDVVEHIKSEVEDATVVLYADDMAIQTASNTSLKLALEALKSWSDTNRLQVNAAKTKIVKHRKAGRYAKGDVFKYDGVELEKVNNFVYLGLTIQPSLCCTMQVDRVKRKGLTACGIMASKLQKISLGAAMRIFDAKIRPVLTYALHLYSDRLSDQDMLELDKVKHRFLKKTLALPTWTGNEFLYKLCGGVRFCQELHEKGYPLNEVAFQKYLAEVRASISRENRRTRNRDAIEDDSWKGIMQPRHLIIGYTAHGHHHLVCQDNSFHEEPNRTCRCKHCGRTTIRSDHLMECPHLNGSLGERYQQALGS